MFFLAAAHPVVLDKGQLDGCMCLSLCIRNWPVTLVIRCSYFTNGQRWTGGADSDLSTV